MMKKIPVAPALFAVLMAATPVMLHADEATIDVNITVKEFTEISVPGAINVVIESDETVTENTATFYVLANFSHDVHAQRAKEADGVAFDVQINDAASGETSSVSGVPGEEVEYQLTVDVDPWQQGEGRYLLADTYEGGLITISVVGAN